ncbi:hypothetical protein GCM10017653_41230 [Ancylobacter defluvii]|uniref:Uncharacterized protein n=1 Tax=Ancylobacter defluvii TaxID=1282440 RepID=A0A9W6NCQ4_9HYPH|nr:hypothetical protein GCM10017653_41230 [Ancylobacter defluvii]
MVGDPDIGPYHRTITLACALGYLDLRFPDYDWRAGHPGAGDWFAATSAHPSLEATRAPEALAAEARPDDGDSRGRDDERALARPRP